MLPNKPLGHCYLRMVKVRPGPLHQVRHVTQIIVQPDWRVLSMLVSPHRGVLLGSNARRLAIEDSVADMLFMKTNMKCSSSASVIEPCFTCGGQPGFHAGLVV